MEKIYDLIIVGSGPAGLAAAIYAKRAELDTLVVEREMMSGGQILNTYEVDNYPGLPGSSGFDLGMKFREHADRLGASFAEDRIEKLELSGEIKTVVCEKESYRAKTVILATGAHHRKLGVPGEEELSGAGVSYCATCDGAFFRDKTVAVIGGGDVALEDAIFLSRICSKVYLIHRRDTLSATRSYLKPLEKAENIEFLWNRQVTGFDVDGTLTGLTLTDTQTGAESRLPVDGLFVAIGRQPNTWLVKGQLELDRQGYIVADESCRTSQPGVFAIGDVRTKPLRQVVTAVADGATASKYLEEYLNGLS